LGAEGLLTSDYFGLRTQLDDETQKLLDEKVAYVTKDGPLSEKDEKVLEALNQKLDAIGLLSTFSDPYYTAFLRAVARRNQLKDFQKPSYSTEELDSRKKLVDEILQELEAEQGHGDAVH
jgi:hypothetical protein